MVFGGFCGRCLVQVAYGIGIADPISLNVDTYGTTAEGFSEERLVEIVRESFNLKPGRIIEQFDLKKPIFKKTTLYGHFLKAGEDFKWEIPKDLSSYKK